MANVKSRQNVNRETRKWDSAISQAKGLLVRVENRAARLKGAIKTFAELRDAGHKYTGPSTPTDI